MIRKLWPLLIGFTIWALGFLAIYSLQALGCVWSWSPTSHRTILITASLVTIVALLATLVLQLRRIATTPSRIEQAGTVLTATTLPITLVVFAPTAFLSMCT